ncbi:MAG: uncharacterized protein A8A55_1854 [Amphiamblys sp. WSBS2006]|nr:MAG: uncharacterized protein A8A55_1854 [Amphiamblys sp. WSBS2006]
MEKSVSKHKKAAKEFILKQGKMNRIPDVLLEYKVITPTVSMDELYETGKKEAEEIRKQYKMEMKIKGCEFRFIDTGRFVGGDKVPVEKNDSVFLMKMD